MRASNIKVGAIYRHKTSSIGYAQALSIIPPKTAENTGNYTVVKCAWATSPTTFQKFSMLKYFKPSDLIENFT